MVDYRLCSLARDRGEFWVCGLGGEAAESVTSESEARRMAEARWPGSKFALTTVRKLVELKRPDIAKSLGEHSDAVVIAVVTASGTPLEQGGRTVPDAEVLTALGIIGGPVHGPACIPFSSEIWGDLINSLIPRH